MHMPFPWILVINTFSKISFPFAPARFLIHMTTQSVKNLGSGTIRMLNWLARATMASRSLLNLFVLTLFLDGKKIVSEMLKTGLPPNSLVSPPPLFSRKNLMKLLDLSPTSRPSNKNPNPSNLPSIPKQDFPNYESHLNSATPEFPTPTKSHESTGLQKK